MDRLTLLAINQSGSRMHIRCTVCGVAFEIDHGVNFKPRSIFDSKKGKTVHYDKPKKIIKEFLEIHYGAHMNGRMPEKMDVLAV